MEPADRLVRFFYLGHVKPIYGTREDQAEAMNELALQATGTDVTAALLKCFVDNADNPPKMDSVSLFIATYLAGEQTEENKSYVAQNFVGCLRTADDLFLFVRDTADLRKLTNKKGFAKTTRKIITKWYQSQTAADLAQMLYSKFGLYGWCHADLFRLCHININGFTPEMKRVCEVAFRKKFEEDTTPMPDYLQKLYKIIKLRSCEDLELAERLIKANDLTIDDVSPFLLRSRKITEQLLPKMTFKQMLSYIFTFHEMKLLRHRNFSQVFVRRLVSKDIMKNCKVHPIVVLLVLRKYEKQKRYSKPAKLKFYEKKVKKNQCEPKKYIVEALYNAFEKSIKFWPDTGLRICVTINLQTNYKTKKVFGFEQLNCLDASIALAYSIFRREKNAKVFTFTKDDTVQQIEWKNNMNYKQANETCTPFVNDHNIARVAIPIIKALPREDVYDLFITILSTSALGAKNLAPPTAVLQTYRQNKNSNARCLVISLKRNRPGLKYEANADTGFMEICGMHDTAPAIMNAYAKSLFK